MLKRFFIAFLSLSFVSVLLGWGLALWLVNADEAQIQYLPDNSFLDETFDISNLSYNELCQVLDARASRIARHDLMLEIDGKYYEISRKDIGDLDVEATAQAAFALWSDTPQIKRIIALVKSYVTEETPQTHEIETVYETNDAKIKKRVKKIASLVDTGAVDAAYVYDEKTNKLKTRKAQEGIEVKVSKTVKRIKNALASDMEVRDVSAVYELLKPQKTKPGRAIFVDTQLCRLYLYINGKVSHSYACSPGRSGYETPTGDFYILYKDASPVWVNPHSSWSKNMPETIEAGINNPLGLRALALSCGGGIYIHGTTNLSALGTRDSHGCIRLANANILKLFGMVEKDDQVFVR